VALAKTKAIALFGLNGTLIDVEADISSNLPNFILVGLPDASLSEATSRVRAACTNSGLSLPGRRITVNLSPASVPKRGSSFDLAIAISVLAAAGSINADRAASWLHIGELALDGSIRRVNGVLPSLLAAKELGWLNFIVPRENLSEAMVIEGIKVEAYDHLTQVASFHGSTVAARASIDEAQSTTTSTDSALCYSDVLGQPEVIDAMVVAATGGHHLLMVGSPGSGKTMIAERLPSILPELTLEQAIETAAVESLSGLPGGIKFAPPFRAPHHNSSASSLIGGGLSVPRPATCS
jgi:magnesium chelatase family protein